MKGENYIEERLKERARGDGEREGYWRRLNERVKGEN